jgi:hypothetical protein
VLKQIVTIAVLCIVIGGASIPVSFTVSPNPVIVWIGNSLGSLLSAFVVIFIAERITDEKFKKRVTKWRIGNKVITVMDEGDKNKKIVKARTFINKHGIKIFALFCPIFPGAFIATITVYALNLDKRSYKIWLMPGIFLVSGFYVFGYWWAVVRTH